MGISEAEVAFEQREGSGYACSKAHRSNTLTPTFMFMGAPPSPCILYRQCDASSGSNSNNECAEAGEGAQCTVDPDEEDLQMSPFTCA
jgi:hypothetical protein